MAALLCSNVNALAATELHLWLRWGGEDGSVGRGTLFRHEGLSEFAFTAGCSGAPITPVLGRQRPKGPWCPVAV